MLSVLLAASVFTALPLSAGAAETGSASAGSKVAEGTTGDCAWELDSWGTLTVSGSGATADYTSNDQPWAAYAGDIQSIEVSDGVTALGKFVFANLSKVDYVFLADSVTSIGQGAFSKCSKLSNLKHGDNIASIGGTAFANTKLKGFVIKNPECQIGIWALGFNYGKMGQMNKVSGFLVYGHADSAAQTYAETNGFSFIDLDSEAYYVAVNFGTAYNIDNQAVTEAHAGELITLKPDKLDRFRIFREFYSDDVEIDETNWSFIMPDEGVVVYMDYDQAYTLDIDLTHSPAYIDSETYDYLVALINRGQLNGEPVQNSSDNYTVTFADDSEILLTPTQISVYDYDYAPCYSVALSGDYTYNPVNFIFAGNKIFQGDVDVTLPAVGSAWDYYTMQANVVPTDSDFNRGRFTVTSAIWYNQWGLSLFDTFKGNEKYFVTVTVAPEDGYYFTLNSEMVFHAEGYNDIRLQPLYMNADGSVVYSNGDSGKQYRFVGGEPHSITVNNGFAVLDAGDGIEDQITQAVPGQYVYYKPDISAIDDSEFILLASIHGESDDVEARMTEMMSVGYFYMPDNDVNVNMVFETEQQKNSVLDFYNSASVTVPGGYYQTSEAFGVQHVLALRAADNQYNSDSNTTWYDIDGNGSWDIGQSVNEFSLLDTNSLTENVTLETTRSETMYYPVRSVKIQVKAPVKHKITVIGGVASSKRGDFANNYVITEAEEGAGVYVVPDYDDLGDDCYLAQFSSEAHSDDVTIYDEGGISFVMPDKDVTVTYSCDILSQDISIFDFRNDNTVTVPDDGTGPRSEAYGVSMLIRLMSKSASSVDNNIYDYDMDGDGSFDIRQNLTTNEYTLLDTNSLDEYSQTFKLSRELSWTLPVRSLLIHKKSEPSTWGDVNYDGKVTVEVATLIQRHLAEFLNPNNGPLIDETDAGAFFRADTNRDGRLTILDVLAIQRSLSEIA